MTMLPCLVILAGGQSTRMGTDKAIVALKGQRLVDILIDRFASKASPILLSARQDYGTGLDIIRDNPVYPDGPVGGIFSIAAGLQDRNPSVASFVTVPVDAPYAPIDLVERLSADGGCAVAQDEQRMHPTFAYWRCDTINRLRTNHVPGERAPSLQWLAKKSNAKTVAWKDSSLFANINRPQDLAAAEDHKNRHLREAPVYLFAKPP
ncbi:molybdenum cofactor guanylyltransferase [Parasphingorhabdus sp.]|uniref:molybdenum cofactor guanylyltransferase n=1 Tax=Parasphingorhabdus sp. TaxID=2709688 RepID=UPI003265FC20